MDPDSRVRDERPFSCDVCDRRFKNAAAMRNHKQFVHGEKIFKCPQLGCGFSASRKTGLAQHTEGAHGTAGSLACDHPGCTYQSTWRTNIAVHKRLKHTDKRPFPCDQMGCSYRAKTTDHLTRHRNTVHLNIRDKRCHVCEKGFRDKSSIRTHMTKHEGKGHEIAKCEDCCVNLRCKSTLKPKKPVNCFTCDHPGCNYKSQKKSMLSRHQKRFHSEERPFACSHAACSYRCKSKSDLTRHQKQVHLKIKTKLCHVCDKRFFLISDVRAHMLSLHQLGDHDIDKCVDCVTNLTMNHRLSQVQMAWRKRRAGEESSLTTANKLGIEKERRKSRGKEGNSSAKEPVKSETTGRLNDDLIDVHMDMELLSLF